MIGTDRPITNQTGEDMKMTGRLIVAGHHQPGEGVDLGHTLGTRETTGIRIETIIEAASHG